MYKPIYTTESLPLLFQYKVPVGCLVGIPAPHKSSLFQIVHRTVQNCRWLHDVLPPLLRYQQTHYRIQPLLRHLLHGNKIHSQALQTSWTATRTLVSCDMDYTPDFYSSRRSASISRKSVSSLGSVKSIVALISNLVCCTFVGAL